MTDEIPPGPSSLDGEGKASRQDVESIYRHLEEGDILESLELAQSLSAEHPDDGNVGLAHAAVAHEVGFAREALQAAQGAQGLGGDDESFRQYYVAASQYRLWKFDPARETAESLVRAKPDFGEGWYLLAQIAEMQQDEIGARRGYDRAYTIDPARFLRPSRITAEALDEVIAAATGDLPEEFHKSLAELSLIVQPLVSWEMVTPDSEAEDPFPPDLLGLFVGASRLDHSVFNPVEQPGVIFLFQKNLERVCADRIELEEEIRITVWHELAHYLGFDDNDLDRLGLG